MTPSNPVTVNPSPLKLLGILGFSGLGITGSLAGVLLSLFSWNWFLSSGWVIVVVTGVLVACCFGALVLVALIGRRPRVEIGPEGFVNRNVFGSRLRRWSDIEGSFVVIKVGFSKGVGYHLTEALKESAGIKQTTLFAGNDEVISGLYEIPFDELAELLNQHKGQALGSS